MIVGANPDLANITLHLTDPLPPSGSVNASTITWTSDKPGVVSNNGQTINRPPFSSGDTAVTLTATLVKDAASDTKDFSLTVIKLNASSAKELIEFKILGNGTVTEGTHTVAVTVPFGTDVTTLAPAIVVSPLATVSPLSGIVNNFTTPQTYTVTAEDGISTQDYTVTVTVDADPDIAKVTADKNALIPGDIKGFNPDLDNITVALSNPLPSNGLINSSNITWASGSPLIVSDNGQTINRPTFSAGNATVTFTATLVLGAVTQTKDFTLTVLKADPSSDKAILTYTIFGDGTVNEQPRQSQ